MDYFQGKGWSHDQAAGIVANLNAESAMDPTAQNKGHYGLAQWGGLRLGDFSKWAGFGITDPRADFMKQLGFVDHELREGNEQVAGNWLKDAQNAARAGYVVSHAYERPGDSVQDALRSGAAAHLAQTTTINVYGSKDPQEAARLSSMEHERATRAAASAMLREFASAVS